MNPARDATAASPQALLAHAEWVRRLARALVRPDDADDVVQQTWAQALVAPRPARNLRGWLGAIARNVVRRNARDDATRTRLDPLVPPPAHAPDPVQSVARAELHRRVVEAVLALDEPYRSTLVMRFFDDQPADAIARAAGVPIETVRTRVKRGLALVRAKLGGEFERAGESLLEGLAPLFVMPIVGVSAGVGAASGGAIGAGVAAMSTASKLSIAAAALVVVAVTAWRFTATDADLQRRPDAPRAAATPPLPPPATAAAPVAADATREAVPLPSRSASAAATKPGEDAAPFTIDGRVVDENGAAVAGAIVLMVDAKSSWSNDRSQAADVAMWILDGPLYPEKLWDRATRSAGDGTFRFEGVDSFRAFNFVAADELAGIGVAHAPIHREPQPTEITLTPLVVVRGRVTDPEGHAVPKSFVWCDIGTDPNRITTSKSVTLRPDDTFCITTLPLPGFFVGAQTEDGRLAERVAFKFGPGDPLHGTAELVLREPGNRCCGRIVDAGGAPLDLAATLLPKLNEWERADGGVRVLQLVACMGEREPAQEFRAGIARNGTIDFQKSTYAVELIADSHWIALVARDRTLGSVSVSLTNVGTNGPDLMVDLSRFPSAPSRASLRVQLRDAETGAPLSKVAASFNFQSIFEDEQGRPVGIAPMMLPTRRDDAAGTAWFDDLHRGHCTLTVKVDGMAPVRRQLVVVPRAEPYELEIPMRVADADVRGVVVDQEANAVANASVLLFARDESGFDLKNPVVVHTNADGRFHFDHVVRGESALRIAATSFAPTVVTLKAAPQCDAGTIVVGSGGQVEVEVVAASGDSAPTASPEGVVLVASSDPRDASADAIHVVRSDDGAPLLDWSSGHGRGAVERLSNPPLTFENAVRWTSSTRCTFALPPGRATLEVVAGKDRRFSRELDVVAGRTLHVKLE